MKRSILICTDNKKAKVLRQLILQCNLSCDITSILHISKDLLNYNIFFIYLDNAYLEEYETADKIADCKPNTEIIYISSSENFVFESFNHHMSFFVRENVFVQDLMRYLNSYEHHRKQTFLYAHKGKVEYIPYVEIVFFEQTKNILNIHLVDGRILSERKAMKNVMDQVDHSDFWQISQSYIINKNKISSIDHEFIVLVNQMKLHYSSSYKSKLKDYFIVPNDVYNS